MLILHWYFEDGKQGTCVGDYDSLVTVYFLLAREWSSLRFDLINLNGSPFQAVWFDEKRRR